MVHSTSASYTLRDVVRVAFRYRLRAFLLFSAITAATVAYIILASREYASEARIFVLLGRESVSLDPTAAMNPMITLSESRDSEINSVVEILNSRGLAEEVVDQLGAEFILLPQPRPGDKASEEENGYSPSLVGKSLDTVMGWLAAVHIVDPVDTRDQAITEFMQSLHIGVGDHSTGGRGESNVITLGYASHTPEQAQQILATLLDAYVAKHVEAHRTRGSLEFFDTQSALRYSELQQRVEELRDIKSGSDLTSVESRRAGLEDLWRELQSNIHSTRGALASARTQVASLEATLAEVPERTVTESVDGLPNLAADSMREKLYELEIIEQELLSNYTADHPRVVALHKQIDEATAILEQQENQRVQQTTALNPTYQPIELKLMLERASMNALESHLAELENQHQDLLVQLHQLNDDEVNIGRLEREVALLEDSYHTYAVNLEQTRIDHALEDERISNINVVQAASISSDPIRPNKAVIAVLGLFLAMGSTLMLILISHRLDHTFQTPDQVERAIDVPVLGSITYQSEYLPMRLSRFLRR